ncbi:hypothetical protein FOA52_011422 [Chlamydomonas sp. UWO 241]|nr:hypothetical protein FOA52_011422 [Chlamydomonas sp. UWO 241]
MSTLSLGSKHGTPAQLVQTLSRLNVKCQRMNDLHAYADSGIDMLSALLVNLPPSLTSLHLSMDLLRDLMIARGRRIYNLSPFRECTLLEKLQLYDYPSVMSLAPLQARQLQELDLTMTGVSDLSPLHGLPALRSLNLCACNVPNMAPLTSLPALTSVGMPSAVLSNVPLAVLKQLEKLDLNFTSPPDLQPLTVCTGRNELNMRNSAAVQDLLPLTCTDLTRLDASGCSSLEDITPLGACVKLVCLDLRECVGVRDLSALAACTNLLRLCAPGCHYLKDITPLGACIKLLDLDLSKCVAIRNLSALQACPWLQHLNLDGCRGVSRLAPLLNFPKLDSVRMIGCVSVTDRAVLAALPNLRILGDILDAADDSEDGLGHEFDDDEFDDEFEDDEFEDGLEGGLHTDELEDDEFEDGLEDGLYTDEFEDDEFEDV